MPYGRLPTVDVFGPLTMSPEYATLNLNAESRHLHFLQGEAGEARKRGTSGQRPATPIFTVGPADGTEAAQCFPSCIPNADKADCRSQNAEEVSRTYAPVYLA